MSRWKAGLALAALVTVGCRAGVDVQQETTALMGRDREWSQTTKDVSKYLSYFASDAKVYAPGEPVVAGSEAIGTMFRQMSAAPGFSVQWTPAHADVSASGDIGYTSGTYEANIGDMAEKGKYITVWKKQAGEWKVIEDIFNADSAPGVQHVMVAPSALTWGDPPPGLPAGGRVAVVSGDPTQPVPFVLRAQVPAGYRVPLHWHPTTENLTVLSGTTAIGMGEAADQSMTELAAGGFVVLPAEMRHIFMAKTASTIQIHGVGPFAITYVNPADDPRQSK